MHQMASRKHVPIAPATNNQQQDHARYGHGSGPCTDHHQSPQPSKTSTTGTQLNISSLPMSIPGVKPARNVPRALPPPTHIDQNGPDHGWVWANRGRDMRSESTSRPVSPESIGAIERRDSQSTFDEDPRRRKSSTSTITSTISSMRSPAYVEPYDAGVQSYNHRDQLSSPSPSVSLSRSPSLLLLFLQFQIPIDMLTQARM